MASWTDQPTQFKPYVQQLPVEAMVAVGMEKQRRYDEGVRRIQANIDRIAGLDVERDVDRNYLQSSLNQLGDRLKTVAAGDFSNYQLTNSVSGMVNKLAKDPIIISAVKSTAYFRSQIKRIQEDGEAGEDDPANTFDFQVNAAKWLDSPNPGEAFSYSYIKPRDVWKKVKEISDAVGVDSEIMQQLYETDTFGNIKIDETTKKPIWNPIMVEKHLKGKDASKILTAFEKGLTPADYQQLAINGRYVYRNHTPEMLEQELTGRARVNVGKINSEISALERDLLLEKDNARKEQLVSMIDSKRSMVKQIEENLINGIEALGFDPDAAKSGLYTSDYLASMSIALSSQDVSIKHSKSPIWDITMEQNRLNLDIEKEKNLNIRHAQDLALRRELAEMNRDIELYKLGLDSQGRSLGGGITIPKEVDASQVYTAKDAAEAMYDLKLGEFNNLSYEYALRSYKRTANGKQRPDENSTQYDRRVRIELEAKAKNEGLSLNDYVTKVATADLDKWRTGTSPSPDIKDEPTFRRMNELNKDLTVSKAITEDIRESSYQQVRESGGEIVSDQELEKVARPVTLTVGRKLIEGGGTQYTLTEKDVVDYIRTRPRWNTSSGMPRLTITNEERKRAELAEERLRKKFGDAYKDIEDEFFDSLRRETSIYSMSKLYTKRNDDIKALAGIREIMASSAFREAEKIQSEMYQELGVIPQPLVQVVAKGKNEDTGAYVSKLVGVLDGKMKADDIKAAVLENDKAVNIYITPDATGYSPNKYTLKVTTKGGRTVEKDIMPSDYRVLMQQEAPVWGGMPPMITQLRKNRTTNLQGTKNPSTAWFARRDFVNFSDDDYTVSGDLEMGDDPNLAYLTIYYQNKRTRDYEVIEYPDPFPIYLRDGTINPKLNTYPEGVTAEVVRQLIELRNKK